MAIRRLSLFQRAKALVLLKQGKSMHEAVRILRQRYHLNETTEEVRNKYFPNTGSFATANLQGAEGQKIVSALEKMKLTRERMRKLHQDPAFRKALDERSSERMRKLHQDPEFKKKLYKGLAKYWNTYRLRINEEAEKRGITCSIEYVKDNQSSTGEREIIIPATKETALSKMMLQERATAIEQAMQKLPEQERTIIDMLIGFTQEEISLHQAAQILKISEQDAEALFKNALTKLSRNPAIKRLR